MRISYPDFLDLSLFLTRKRETGQTRTVRIFIEHGKKDACPYVRDLREVFVQAGWKPEPVKDLPDGDLKGSAVWFQSAPQDNEAKEFYEKMVRLSQEVHYLALKDVSRTEWQFYVKDQWSSQRI